MPQTHTACVTARVLDFAYRHKKAASCFQEAAFIE